MGASTSRSTIHRSANNNENEERSIVRAPRSIEIAPGEANSIETYLPMRQRIFQAIGTMVSYIPSTIGLIGGGYALYQMYLTVYHPPIYPFKK